MRIFESGRSAFKTLLVSSFLLLGLAGFATQASAQAVVCSGTETGTFNPPLTNTQQNLQITVSASYSPCLVTGVSGITSASVNNQFVRDYACQTLLGGGPGTRVFIWSNGQSSTFSYTATTNSVGGNVVSTLTGNISAGLFQGQSAVVVVTLTSISQADFLTACAGSGITSVSGPTELTILPPL
ncbi:hypothetical protein FAZ69_19125 [Trinickia terrae]|uniref:Spore coat protein U domain-containing protein n=1 Tax=Trinickia terrae TaxID=2571161 RepID=A0A4U1I0W0_9BURK|nr:hypothetical protein [Trinickia terrae]TKC86767.1 hypothetical protein FAZ69_19125 [Trinickia terrae]